MSELVNDRSTEPVPRPETIDSLFTATILGDKLSIPGHLSPDMQKNMEKLISGQNEVQDLLRHSATGTAIDKQHKVVSVSDQLSSPKLNQELKSLEDALRKTKNQDEQKRLKEDLDKARTWLAAPFLERARLAAIELKSGQEFQAEKTLQEALRIKLPDEVSSLAGINKLREDARVQKEELHVKNELLQLWDANIEKFSKITGRKDLRKNDFTNSVLDDPEYGSLNRFLRKNYETLTKEHSWFSANSGITRSDIEKYVDSRNKKLNDFVH